MNRFLSGYGNLRTKRSYWVHLTVYFRWLREERGLTLSPDELVKDNLVCIFKMRPHRRRHEEEAPCRSRRRRQRVPRMRAEESTVWQPRPRGNPSQKHDDGRRPEAWAKYLREDEKKMEGAPAGDTLWLCPP